MTDKPVPHDLSDAKKTDRDRKQREQEIIDDAAHAGDNSDDPHK